MTTPKPLHLTDSDGDGIGGTFAAADVREANVPDAVVVLSTHENDTWTGCALTAPQVRELIRWLAAAIGEPDPAQADVFSFTDTAGQEQRIAKHTLPGDCPVCGHPIHAGAYVTRVVDAAAGLDTWAHEHCEQFPPAVSKTAPDTETQVTHVEGEPQP
jgi:hypothetical protein